jgi:AraC family transcriptional regulator of adaptative response/methylated-DNA-[protein]-cysteine methyltransferase
MYCRRGIRADACSPVCGRGVQVRKIRVGPGHGVWQNRSMHAYDRIARVIRYVDGHVREQPDLATLAQVAGLSRFHFHRLFSDWAGITPARFLQCLTLAHARRLLQAGNTVFETVMATGLSGPDRLHDLCVNLEAASPGELQAGGAGRDIRYGLADSPFGTCMIAENPRGICYLGFAVAATERYGPGLLRKRWPNAALARDDATAGRLAERIFSRHATSGQPLQAHVRGTAFQVRVWQALLAIEPGTLVSYGRLATVLGKPGAARSVGTAIGQNPLSYLIPCHRVIRETGLMGGYHWGIERKRAMIIRESASQNGSEMQEAGMAGLDELQKA